MGNDVGILSFGAYIPRLRLQRQAIAAANSWFNPGLRGLAKGERAMANWDEDAVTMAVEAARDCLAGFDHAAGATLPPAPSPLVSALAAAAATEGPPLLAAGDHRLAKAASPQEMQYGD